MSYRKAPLYLAVVVVVVGGFAILRHLNTDNVAAVARSSTSSELTHVRVADLPVVHALPLYVALEKGYFAEAGLAVEYVKLDSPNLIIDALLAGQVDITSPSGAMGIAGIADVRQPGVLQIYAATGGDDDHRTESLMVQPDADISSFADLKGKRMGILPGIQWRTIAQHLLEQQGLTVDKDVTLVELAPGLQVGALKSGQIDALLAIEPMAIIAEHAGMNEVVRNPNLSAIADPFYPGAGIVSTVFAREHPEAVQAFIGALKHALSDIAADPKDARRYLAGYTPLDDSLIPVAPIMLTKLYSDFSEEDIRAIETFHHIFYEYGVVDEEIPTREMIYTP